MIIIEPHPYSLGDNQLGEDQESGDALALVAAQAELQRPQPTGHWGLRASHTVSGWTGRRSSGLEEIFRFKGLWPLASAEGKEYKYKYSLQIQYILVVHLLYPKGQDGST
ncbi:unnamed protein product [Pieris macdunnoughi]|uniref:Uncharacterized protein n=1 Tax=Pieris macdunnoughi TaxID=345717 RepID=A0A821TGI6_9NEOP|nr:unnamed protein product [Pieris macdunnoughi]